MTPSNPSPGVLPGDVLPRGLYAERSNADATAPLLEQPPLDRKEAPAPSGHVALGQPAGESPAASEVALETSAAPLVARGALLAGFATNFDVLDRAMESTLAEIENMGGDLAVWLDESNAAVWAAGGAAALMAGGGYYWKRRRAGQRLRR